MRISDWSSDVCSSDLLNPPPADPDLEESFAWFEAHPDLFCGPFGGRFSNVQISIKFDNLADMMGFPSALAGCPPIESGAVRYALSGHSIDFFAAATSKTRVMDMLRPRLAADASILCAGDSGTRSGNDHERSEEHTSELQSLMRN